MIKSKWNFIIDGIMFLLMGLLTGIGFLIKYVLVHGEDRWKIYGKNVDMHYLGFDRHTWGKIHLIVALALIAFLALHIILHWKLTVNLFRSLFTNKSVRGPVVIIFILLTVILTVFPFFIRPEISDVEPGKERFKMYAQQTNEDSTIVSEKPKHADSPIVVKVEERHTDEHHHIDSSIEVKGFMTIQEVSVKYDIPCKLIKEKLEIPESVSNNSKLGFLRKEYNFKMSEIKLIIANHIK